MAGTAPAGTAPAKTRAGAAAAAARQLWRGASFSGRADASRHGLAYGILDVPPLPAAIALGLQQFLTMLGSTVLIPFICVPAMGGSPHDLALVICTIFFVSGIITLLQTLIGDRLPIIQGGSFAYINPVLAISGQIKATHTFASEQERFLVTMREVQGAIIGSGLIVMAIGLTGVIKPVLRTISPITVAANIGVLGLALYQVGFPGVAACPQLGVTQIVLTILFSQYLRNVTIRVPGPIGSVRFFELFPVLLSILLTWFLAWLLTIGGAYNNSPPDVQAACRTDQSRVLADAPWVRLPWPGQWGAPTMSWSGTLTMLAGALPAMIESLGDYWAAADISGAPVPPPAVLSRAIALQGASCVLAGVWGTSSGTTAYNENIGSMQITRVGSRRVVQVGAAFAILMGLFGKCGGLFASLPKAMVNGLFCVMFGLIAAVGLSQMRHTDQTSNRNIFILGFSLYMGLSIPFYFEEFAAKHPGTGGPIQTGSPVANNILNAVFSTAAAVALLLTLFLDNTIPGSDAERGLLVWQEQLAAGASDDEDDVDGGSDLEAASCGAPPPRRHLHWWEDDHMNRVYGLPFDLTRKLHLRVLQPLAAWRHKHIWQPLLRVLPAWCFRGRRRRGAPHNSKQQELAKGGGQHDAAAGLMGGSAAAAAAAPADGGPDAAASKAALDVADEGAAISPKDAASSHGQPEVIVDATDADATNPSGAGSSRSRSRHAHAAGVVGTDAAAADTLRRRPGA